MAFFCGIDEAGRGPVLGPMVIAGVKISLRTQGILEGFGVNDSKKILPKRREELFSLIKGTVEDYSVIKISPAEIDKALSTPGMNLNWLEAVTTIKILKNLDAKKAYIDCPTATASKYSDYLKNRLDGQIELIVEHRADENYIAAAAASILAKVERDREIEELRKLYGDIGSGYPSDPKTKAFIEKNLELDIFRRSWSTWQNLNKKRSQQSLLRF